MSIEDNIKKLSQIPTRHKNDLPWYLYLTTNEEARTVKVGVTQNPKGRVDQMQVGNHATLKMYCLVKYLTEKEALDAESLLMTSWHEYRIGGEWFKENPCSQELIKDGVPIVTPGKASKQSIRPPLEFNQELYSTKEASELVGVAESVLRKEISKQHLRAGLGRYKIEKQDLDRWYHSVHYLLCMERRRK